jgi:hypothetical protein
MDKLKEIYAILCLHTCRTPEFCEMGVHMPTHISYIYIYLHIGTVPHMGKDNHNIYLYVCAFLRIMYMYTYIYIYIM